MPDPHPQNPIIPVIVGPTAGGKSALAMELARVLAAQGRPAELVSADAFQIYRRMDIGTAKPSAEEQAAVRHHLIDLIDLAEPAGSAEPFTVHDWLGLANELTADLLARGITPIVVGGTNLYVKAYLEGLFDAPEPSEAIRAQVAAMPQAERRTVLQDADPEAFGRIHAADERRTGRALEVFLQTGTPISELQQQWDRAKSLRPGVQLIGLDWPIEAINRRINARVKGMVEAGLVEEVRGLWEAGLFGGQAGEAIGYKQLIPHFEGGPDAPALEACIERIKIETRRLGKNQRTWLKRFRAVPGARWFEGAESTPGEIAQVFIFP
ncbi:MAG: tRNA dimethylallyltransferase [Phycisphaerales bacterium]|jgi:tRNA dimethylallyltransferase